MDDEPKADQPSGGETIRSKVGRDDAPGDRRTCVTIQSLVADFHGDVYRYAFRLAGTQADAEDLTQQTFLIAQQRLGQLREPAKAGSWLFAILRSCFLKSHRKHRPVSASVIELDVESVPDDVQDDDIDRQLLQLAINQLKPEWRVVLVMFYFEQRSYKEIAAELQIPIGTVMSQLSRAKSQLRGILLEKRHRDLDATDSPSTASSTAASTTAEKNESFEFSTHRL